MGIIRQGRGGGKLVADIGIQLPVLRGIKADFTHLPAAGQRRSTAAHKQHAVVPQQGFGGQRHG